MVGILNAVAWPIVLAQARQSFVRLDIVALLIPLVAVAAEDESRSDAARWE